MKNGYAIKVGNYWLGSKRQLTNSGKRLVLVNKKDADVLASILTHLSAEVVEVR